MTETMINLKWKKEVNDIKALKDILETLIYITVFLVVPLTVCFGLYITRNPWCLIGLMFCYSSRPNNKGKTNQDKNIKQQEVEEE